jgi:phosphatidylglycerol:prolipoprotein diacylglycerol transferase
VAFPHGAPASTVQNMSQLFHIPFAAGTNPTGVVAVHPTQLYEVTLGFFMFWILWKLRDHKHAEGWLFGVYCILAGIERFVIEIFRAKDDRFFGPLTMAQMIAMAFVVIGIIILYARRNVTDKSPGIYATA